MAADVSHLRSYCHVCLLLTFSHAIGLHMSRDFSKEFPAITRNHRMLYKAPTAAISTLPHTLPYDVTQNAVFRSTTASDDVIENAVNVTYRARRRREVNIVHYSSTTDDKLSRSKTVWNRELAARTLQELEQQLEAARVNCSGTSGLDQTTSGLDQSLNVELPARVLDRFSAEAASAVHAANVVSLLLQTPAEVTSQGDAFYFSFARAIVESAGDWVNSATLVVERPGRTTIGPRAARLSPDLLRIRVSDVGHAQWYTGLLQRNGGRRGKTGRCGANGWRTREGDIVNKSTVVTELTDVLWSVPYIRCPSLALVNLIVPIYMCGQQRNVIIR